MGRQGSECGECVWEGKVQNRRTVKFETIQQQEGLMRMGRWRGGWAGGEEEDPMRSAFFWVITQRVVVNFYRSSETNLEPWRWDR